MAYSQDLRDRVLAAYDRGMKTKQIADTFQVSRSWARRIKQRRRETGETTARKPGNPGIVKVDREQLKQIVVSHPDATLKEIRQMLGVSCALSTLSVALKQMGFTFKKSRSAPPNRIVRMYLRSARTGRCGAAKATRDA